jgi:hypothetical protein
LRRDGQPPTESHSDTELPLHSPFPPSSPHSSGKSPEVGGFHARGRLMAAPWSHQSSVVVPTSPLKRPHRDTLLDSDTDQISVSRRESLHRSLESALLSGRGPLPRRRRAAGVGVVLQHRQQHRRHSGHSQINTTQGGAEEAQLANECERGEGPGDSEE